MPTPAAPSSAGTPPPGQAFPLPTSRSRPLWLIHHAAGRGAAHPPGSLAGLRDCLQHGARVVELDITPLKGGGFALLHGPELERDTTGSGHVADLTAAQITKLRHIWRGHVTDVPVGLLSQALEVIEDDPHLIELQLDLKPYRPLIDATLSELVHALEPHRERVRVTTPADWALRRLRAMDSQLPLGFDPLLYLEVAEAGGREAGYPPYRQGAYGYWDDHPLSGRRWGTNAEYLSARAEALGILAPEGGVWYISARLLAQALDDGFDWIAYLHAQGAEVDAWTLDAEKPGHGDLARRLAALGLDRITTNDAPVLAQLLDVPVTY